MDEFCITPVPYPIAYALIGGLSTDSVVKHSEALQVFPDVKLIDFDTATQQALQFTHPDHIERVWDDGKAGFKFLKHEGCFISFAPEFPADIVPKGQWSGSAADARASQ